MSTDDRHLVRNILLVAASFGLAAAAGLLRNVIIARTFGIGTQLDVYYAAFRLPDLLFTVVAGASLSGAFVPVFAGLLAKGERQEAWHLASAVTNIVVVIVSVLALLIGLSAPWLVRVLVAPGFDVQARAQTVTMMRLVLISTVIFGVSAVQTNSLHGFKHFLFPALAPVVYPLGIAAGVWWLPPTLGVRRLAIGAIVGATLHLGIQVPALLHYGFRWWPGLGLRRKAVRRVAGLMGPRVLDLGVFHLTILATSNLASRLGPGSVSALEWGWDAMQLPEAVIGTAFGLVALPTLSDLAARGDVEGLRSTLGETLRAVVSLTVPAALGLILLGRPLLQLVYQRGAFDTAATDAVYAALRFYALGLVGHACIELAARAFFAQQDTLTPLLVTSAFAALNILLGIVLRGPLSHGGLALANSLAVSGELVTLLLILRRRWNGVEGRQLLLTLARVCAATLIMGSAVYAVMWGGRRSEMGSLVIVVAGAAVGALTYVAAGLLLHVQGLRWLLPFWEKEDSQSGAITQRP